MATLDQVLAQMAAADMPPLPAGHPVADGRIHRYGRAKKCWYVLHEYAARNGRRYLAGAFGFWQGTENNSIRIRTDWTGIEPDEHRRLQRSQAELERRERAKRESRARAAANRAREQWAAARARPGDGEKCAYLERKRLVWEKGLRLAADGTLLVPMVRYDVTDEQMADPAYTGPPRLAGLQKILPDGTKRFNRGMDPVGAACRFGPKPKDGQILLLGEGLATVLSAHQALEGAYTSYAAFVAGNLERVARILRELYPRSPILVLADDDAYLTAQLNKRLRDDYGVRELHALYDVGRELAGERGPLTVCADVYQDERGTPVLTAGITAEGKLRTLVLRNTGRTKAWEASAAVRNATVAWPEFAERKLGHEPDGARLTDWNDLHCAEGIERVAVQLAAAIRAIEEARERAAQLAAGTPAAGGGDEAPRAAAAGAGGGKGGDGEPDWQLHGALLKRFTQIYPSDTAYDAEKGRVVKIEHMRLRFGRPAVAMWLASRRKRVIDPEQIVFDPHGAADPETTVNLFRGLPALARVPGGSCAKLLELAHYLCGEHHEDAEAPVTSWMLRWLAYPLQHLGAKMQTALVMHGEEGAGKNLLFGAVRRMYGRHGGVITQRQLEDRFNTWQSAKLFVVANEVVTRQEMTHQGGYIRNLITEPEIQINPKFQDQREEANQMNIVFLANAIQPLLLNLNDRRCFVIRTPPARPDEFYRAVGAEIAKGGVAAFYDYLMALDLGDFSEHAKPPMTEAKRALIELGMPTPQLFWLELKEGLLGIPYGPALATDLYQAYSAWCRRNGYKMPEGMKYFSPNFMMMNGVSRVDRPVPIPGRQARIGLAADESRLRKRRIFVMGERELDEAAEKQRIVEGVIEFRNHLREYLREEPFAEGSASHGQGDREQAF